MMQQRAPRPPALPARLLITGFGPFPGVAINASDGLAHVLAARIGRDYHGLHAKAATLPTDWRDAPRLLARLLDHEQPDICLHLGVSAKARGFIVEARARNRTSPAGDANGLVPIDERLVPGAPATLGAGRLAAAVAQRLLDDDLPGQLSRNAGKYLCNAVYYHSLLAARRGAKGRQVLLVHLPDRVGTVRGQVTARPGAGRMPAGVALKGGMALIEACISHWQAVHGTVIASG